MLNTAWRKTVLIILLVLLAVGLYFRAPTVSWRAGLVTRKASGQLPYLPWSDLFRMTLPQRWRASVLPSLPPAFDSMVSSRAEGPCPVLWDTLLGSFWGRDSDAPVLYSTIEQMVIQRERETPQVVVQPGDVVLDVGSHLGTFTRYALRRGARLVVAFEPEPINVTCFKKNFPTELEQGQVILIEAAAWEASGILELASGSDNLSWTFSAVSERQSENSAKLSIKAVTIDDIVEQQELSSIDFIKMNIEGAERYALRGARRTIGRFAPRMDISTHHLPDDPRTIPQLVFEIRPAYRVSFNNRLSEAFFH